MRFCDLQVALSIYQRATPFSAQMSESPLSREQELELHRRLVEADPVAPAEIAEAFFECMITTLRERNSRIGSDLIQDAATEAFLALTKNPRSFDPDKTSAPHPLFTYLLMSAQGDLHNLLTRETNRQRRLVRLENVELSDDGGKYL
ncbi:MAG TPA: hypothetical protein VFE62_14635, partial [Gemmataceae bacterium]|nr:hypothetical protein [Gemmataceae bacterium]